MKKLNKIFFLMIIPMFVFQMSALSLDLSDFENFSDRSMIMRVLNNQSKINQEQKDLLISKKLSPTTECLFTQIKKNNIDNVVLLLDCKLNPNVSYLSEYPIYYASKLNRTEIVKLLLEKDAKLNRGFYSELYEAVKNKNTELAQIFIDRGANVNYMDSVTNNSILYLALKNNMLDIASQLIQKGARPDKKSVKTIKKRKLYGLIEDKQE